jgi:transglutaminase-like putative cysteine protease
MKVELQGLDRAPPVAHNQRCKSIAEGYECEIRAMGPDAVLESRERLHPHLEPSATVQSRHPNIRITAGEIAGSERDPGRQTELLLHWMQSNIERAPFDVFSAVDVLENRKAECQGHAYLFAALARALGIPTRVVSGLVYSEELKGFLFHSWTESWLGDRWQPIDPTFGQATADATHVKLLEGEALADLLPLIDWVGRLSIRVLDLEHQNL